MEIIILPNELVFIKQEKDWKCINKRLGKELEIRNKSIISILEDTSEIGNIKFGGYEWLLTIQLMLVKMLTVIEKGEE